MEELSARVEDLGTSQELSVDSATIPKISNSRRVPPRPPPRRTWGGGPTSQGRRPPEITDSPEIPQWSVAEVPRPLSGQGRGTVPRFANEIGHPPTRDRVSLRSSGHQNQVRGVGTIDRLATLQPDDTSGDDTFGHVGSVSRGYVPDFIPRKSGMIGDIAYWFRVVRLRRSSRNEMSSLGIRAAEAEEERNQKIIAMAHYVIGSDDFDQEIVEEGRAVLVELEERRSGYAGGVAAADGELAALKKRRELVAADRASQLTALENERDKSNAEIKVLTRQIRKVLKRATSSRRQYQRLEKQLQTKEESAASTTLTSEKRVEIRAAISSLQAERMRVSEDDPTFFAKLEELNLQLSSARSSVTDLELSIARLRGQEASDVVCMNENASLLSAWRCVQERNAGKQAKERDATLLEIGQAIHGELVEQRDPRAISIDKQRALIDSLQSRRRDLEYVLLSVETMAVARGMLWVGGIATAVLAVTAFSVFG